MFSQAVAVVLVAFFWSYQRGHWLDYGFTGIVIVLAVLLLSPSARLKGEKKREKSTLEKGRNLQRTSCT